MLRQALDAVRAAESRLRGAVDADDTWATLVTLLLAAACVAGGLWRAGRWEL